VQNYTLYFGQNWLTQQSHGLFATAKLLVYFRFSKCNFLAQLFCKWTQFIFFFSVQHKLAIIVILWTISSWMAVGITEKLTSAFSVKQQLFSVTYLMTPATRPARQLTTLCGHLFWSTWRVLQLLTAPNWTHWCLYNHRLRFTTSHVENSEIMPILCSEKNWSATRYAPKIAKGGSHEIVAVRFSMFCQLHWESF